MIADVVDLALESCVFKAYIVEDGGVCPLVLLLCGKFGSDQSYTFGSAARLPIVRGRRRCLDGRWWLGLLTLDTNASFRQTGGWDYICNYLSRGYGTLSGAPRGAIAACHRVQDFCALKVLIKTVKIVINQPVDLSFVLIFTQKVVPIINFNLVWGINAWLVIY